METILIGLAFFVAAMLIMFLLTKLIKAIVNKNKSGDAKKATDKKAAAKKDEKAETQPKRAAVVEGQPAQVELIDAPISETVEAPVETPKKGRFAEKRALAAENKEAAIIEPVFSEHVEEDPTLATSHVEAVFEREDQVAATVEFAQKSAEITTPAKEPSKAKPVEAIKSEPLIAAVAQVEKEQVAATVELKQQAATVQSKVEKPEVIETSSDVIYIPVDKKVIDDDDVETELFTLSRTDVMDHFSAIGKDKARFTEKPAIKESQNVKEPDFMMCGDWCFGLMFDRNQLIFNFVLKMSKTMFKIHSRFHTITPMTVFDEHWYNVVVDHTFKSKKELFKIIDESYFYTLDNYSKITGDSARLEQDDIRSKILTALTSVEQIADKAEIDYRAELEKFKASHYAEIRLSRKDIAAEMRKREIPDMEIVERFKQPQLPLSLKYKDATFAMLYASDDGVLMVIQIPRVYANSLGVKHPEICRTKFPKGEFWYQLPVDGAFENDEAVYNVLEFARIFVGEKADANRATAAKTSAAKKKAAEEQE